MFKSKAVLAGIILSMVGTVPVAFTGVEAGQEAGLPESTEITEVDTGNALAYYSIDGGNTWTPIYEEEGIAERLAPGMTRTRFMEQRTAPPDTGK